jgi:hypothetical protein
MLPRPLRQESLSKAYVRAIAAKAGLVCVESEYDFGIDMSLRPIREMAGRLSDDTAQINLQIKSTTRATVSDEAILYDLDVKNYEDLRAARENHSDYLVVFVMPADEATWVAQTMDELILRHCAYWLSLNGYPETNSTSTVRVSIPRENIFSAEAVQAMVQQLIERKKP